MDSLVQRTGQQHWRSVSQISQEYGIHKDTFQGFEILYWDKSYDEMVTLFWFRKNGPVAASMHWRGNSALYIVF